jgi:hypothetical protein
MLTLTKKTWKYIFYAVLALVLLYVVFFSSTRERFTSVNPLPTQADFRALSEAFDKVRPEFSGQPQAEVKMTNAALKSAPESFKAMVRFSRANIIPLLPYKIVKANTNPDGSDMFDFYTIYFSEFMKDSIIFPIAYAVKQQSSPPTLSAFIDMVVKIFRENAPNPPQMTPELQGLIDQMKKGETTIEYGNVGTIPNPGYWAYVYIYGKPKTASTTSTMPSSSSKKSSGGSIGGGKCTPSVVQIPGGVTETRCFNS